ncbi:MAG: M23 family metallopeptidase [Candidatus Marinimicrobia bacterium]|nr:M23 family metallopeptidase [Candidatus Neomarinimicrobiota bacterium]MCF7922341.1 M23 family metallopeptidase [Candidatus Neomarinimicrobiota bacterium]
MKHEKYTILILPDNEANGRSYSITATTVNILKFLIVLLLGVIILFSTYYLPKAIEYRHIKMENDFLLNERQDVAGLLKNSKRIEEINHFIESTLGSHYDLSANPGDSTAASMNNWELSPFETMGLLKDLPTYLPIKGFVNAGFKVREGLFSQDHLGIDLSSIEDRVVKAAGRGYVIFADWTYRFGNTIIIDHGNGYLTVYGHNEQNLVTQRQVVDRAEPIAIMGNTGISDGAHLHFEIWYEGVPLDPATFITELSETNSPTVEKDY